MDKMVEALASEIKIRHLYLENTQINSIYIGGGTPSLITEVGLGVIFSAVSDYFSLNHGAEVTLEANPDDITAQNLMSWKRLGINRLSIGIQSFNDEELVWMNRGHTSSQSEKSVKMAQDAGFSNISIDLIYGSKFQDEKSWEKALNRAIELNVQHISAYNLTIENKTVLGVKQKKGIEPSVNDDLSSKLFVIMLNILNLHEFIHYEISNFAKEGFTALHNSNYWRGLHYLGIGPSAHSYNGTSRQWNIKNNNLYLKAVENHSNFYEKEELGVKERFNEYILTRLRTIWGCNANEIEKSFGSDFLNHFLKRIKLQKDFVVEKEKVYTLNLIGKLQADRIAAELFI